MKWFVVAVAVLTVLGCNNTDVETGDGDASVTVNNCSNTSEKASALAEDAGDAGTDPLGVIATCDDHLPCTMDVQCTPCSQVPEEIRYIKATCTPDNSLSPFCFAGDDISTRVLVYTGCVHFIADQTLPGVNNACFPVRWPSDPESEAHSGVCNSFGVCVENQAP